MPPSFLEASKRDVLDQQLRHAGVPRRRRAPPASTPRPLNAACSYMLNQAEIGMTCALGTGGDMVVNLVRAVRARRRARRACAQVRDRASGPARPSSAHRAHRRLRPRRARDDRHARRRRVAPQRLQVVRVERQRPGVRRAGQARRRRRQRPRHRHRSSCCASGATARRNGIRIRRLKDKLGTKAVASAEVEFVDAEAFLLVAGAAAAARPAQAGDGKGLARMMEMTNGARLGIAMMGLGCARRALVEALCYARARDAFGRPLAEQPLMQRKLAELIVEVEAAQALVFDGYDPTHRLRIGAPLIKLRRRPPRHHRGERRHRGARRQRLRRELAGGPHPARRAGQHAVGGARQHPVPRRAPRHRARAGRRRVPRPRCARPWRSAPAGDATTALGRRAASIAAEAAIDPLEDARPHHRRSAALPARHSSWSTCTPARCCSSRPAGSRRELGADRKALVARLYAR